MSSSVNDSSLDVNSPSNSNSNSPHGLKYHRRVAESRVKRPFLSGSARFKGELFAPFAGRMGGEAGPVLGPGSYFDSVKKGDFTSVLYRRLAAMKKQTSMACFGKLKEEYESHTDIKDEDSYYGRIRRLGPLVYAKKPQPFVAPIRSAPLTVTHIEKDEKVCMHILPLSLARSLSSTFTCIYTNIHVYIST